MNDSLYQSICDFDIDGGEVALTFAARLARENAWSVAFAERVIAEYKHFVYLAMTADHIVTQSVAVDEAWHLHLTYTKSYWDRMCGEVLGKPLHHNPTEGGRAEQQKFVDLYNRTLATYAETFGGEPPADIWPAAEIRFDPAEQPVKILPREFWMFRKRKVIGRTKLAYVFGFFVALLSGCAWLMEEPGSGEGQTAITEGDIYFGIFVVVCVLVLLRLVAGGGGGRGGGSGCGGFFGCGGWGSGCGGGYGGGCGG